MEPRMNADERRLNQITERVIGCIYEVANRLGCGFLEKVYENALLVELTHAGLKAKQQEPINIFYRDALGGQYFADLLVEDSVVIELKIVKSFDDVHTAQCLNYLRATGIKVCLLVNFAKPRVEIKRIVSNL
jgi:GxxExxY protein